MVAIVAFGRLTESDVNALNGFSIELISWRQVSMSVLYLKQIVREFEHPLISRDTKEVS